MLTKLTNAFSGLRPRKDIYSYRPGVAYGDLGVGSDGLALMKPFSNPIDAPYHALTSPRQQLRPYQGTYTPQGQAGVISGAAAGGVWTGSIALQALADFQAAANGDKS